MKGVLFAICDWGKPLTSGDLRYLGWKAAGLKGWWNYFKPRRGSHGAPKVRIYLAPEGKGKWTVTLRQDKSDLIVLNSLPLKLTKKQFQNLLNAILGLVT